jgi:uncharacterized coiled-coil protein SlyX
MPQKKNTNTMEARVSMLEEKLAIMEVTLNEVQTTSSHNDAIIDDNINKLFKMVKAIQKPNKEAGKSSNFVEEYVKGEEYHSSHPKVTIDLFGGSSAPFSLFRTRLWVKCRLYFFST